MTPLAQLQALAQSVYLVIKNRYFDDLTSADGKVFVAQITDWGNQFIDELESELDSAGQPIDWHWVRQNRYELGTATAGEASIQTPTAITNLISGENRYVQIIQGTSVVSNWAVVSPNQISSRVDRIVEDAVAIVGASIVFSRVFKETEAGGTVIGDVTLPIPRFVYNRDTNVATNVKAITTIVPRQLLVLGIAKNATLPDIVQGGLSPSYAQKYGDLLEGAIARNATTSRADILNRDELGYIRGVGY